MNWSEIFNWHTIAVAAVAIIGAQLTKWLASGAIVADFVTAEVKKLQAAYEATSFGKITAKFQAEQAIWKLVEAEIPIVFHKLTDDAQAALTSGDLGKVDWAAMGRDVWAGIRDKAKTDEVDYLQHAAAADGALLCSSIAQSIFSRLHMNIQIAQANPPAAPVVATTNPAPVSVTVSSPSGQ